MPAKRNTNKLSQLYKTIDQKGLSQDAKETLKKLRLATANFNKKEGKEADAFNLFYNRLLAKKPTAIKTTKEYKEMVLEKKREVARKMMEAKKAKQESRQGQGSERDASRPAKPFGWRLKGKHNYRKPTRADISSGKAYYEGRINRADSKRTKFPMLERGGYMAHGGKVYSSDDAYEVIILKDGVEVDRVLVRARNKGEAREMYEDTYESKMMKKHGEDITYEIIIAPSKMADGGSTKFAWQNAQVGDSVLVIEENKMGTIVTTYGRRIHVRFPDGSEKTYFAEDLEFISNDEFAKGGAIKNQYEGRTPEDIWNSYSKDQRLHFLYDHAEEINEYKAIESEDEKPWFNAAYKSNWDDLDMDVKNRFANHVRGGQYADGGEVDKGGMIYALRNEISSGTIANKSGVNTYQEVAQVRRDAIDYYLKNGDVPYSLGELDRVLSMSNKMDNSDDMKNRRTLKFSDAVLYKGDMYTFVKRDGDVGFVSNSQGAWGMSGSFLPLRNLLRSDLEENLTDMYGNKFYIPPYDELIKMPYGFAKGGSMDNGGVFYTESHKLGHE